MSGESLRSDEVVHAAAAVLVLMEGQAANVAATLQGMAGAAEIEAIEQRLVSGDRASRARALAGPLGRIALSLDEWGLR